MAIKYSSEQVNRAADAAEKAAFAKRAILKELDLDPSNATLQSEYKSACKEYERLADIAHAYAHGLPM